MADLLIPLLLVFAVVGGVLVWALVRQLRELDDASDRPFGGWREGGPDPEPPWRRQKTDRPASGPAQRQAPSGRPTLPWQRRARQARPARPQPAAQPTRAAPAPRVTRPEPTQQPARPERTPQPARPEAAPPPTRPERTPEPGRPALPWQRGGEQAERGGPRRPRQPAWLTLPGQRRSKDAPREQAASPLDQARRGEQGAAPDRPAPLWQRPRGEAPEEPPAPAPGSGRCSTCGGTGQAIVSRSGGGLGRGPCPVCQG